MFSIGYPSSLSAGMHVSSSREGGPHKSATVVSFRLNQRENNTLDHVLVNSPNQTAPRVCLCLAYRSALGSDPDAPPPADQECSAVKYLSLTCYRTGT